MAKRRQNLSSAAKVALAIVGVVLVPVALAGAGIYAVTQVARRAVKGRLADLSAASLPARGHMGGYEWAIDGRFTEASGTLAYFWSVTQSGQIIDSGAEASENAAKQAVRDTLLAAGVQ